MNTLDNKLAVVTGGNSGIGLASARRFVEAGACVVIAGRNPETLARAQEELGSNARTVHGDLTEPAARQALLDVAREFGGGGIDILFANAGGAQPVPAAEITADALDFAFDQNFRSPLLLITEAIPLLTSGASVIINTSVAGRAAVPGMILYSAAKAALSSAVRGLAVELAPKGIRVNSIAPGPIATPILDRLGFPQATVDEFTRSMIDKVPLGRLGEADEVATLALLLASPGSTYITGTELVVDGGYLAQ